MICARCGTVFCIDLETDAYWLSESRVRHCSKVCRRKARPSYRRLRHKSRNPGKNRRQVAALRRRDGDSCHLCGLLIDFTIENINDPMRYSRDHLVPQSLGGDGTVANMRLAHRKCNIDRDREPLAAPGGTLPGLGCPA